MISLTKKPNRAPRIEYLGRIESMSEVMGQPTPAECSRIAKEIEAKRAVMRTALGFPEGLAIPRPQLPDTPELQRAALEIANREFREVLNKRYAATPPEGPEYEALGVHLNAIREWCSRLEGAIKGEEDMP